MPPTKNPPDLQEDSPAGSPREPAGNFVVGAIPARYGSTRLPGKALRLIAGRPMVQHVYERACEATALDRVVVLTDDERILEVVRNFGGTCEMTPTDCASGTDRIAWAARRWDATAVVNIQGDEPLIDPAVVSRLADYIRSHRSDPVATLAAPATDQEVADPDCVKVVVDRRGYALYFSRAAIPYPRSAGVVAPWKHIGIYGYQREALLQLASLDPTPLERCEGLEQLRALENGVAIRVLEVERSSPGVDTAEDLERVRQMLEQGDGS